jgi:two-component system chemotaxis sensor kinase CheA
MNIDNEILQEFLVEAGELFEQLNGQLIELENNPQDKELLNSIFRAFHTIKGGAGFMKLTPMVEICHRAEDVFNLLRQGDIKIDADLVDIFFQVLDVLGDMFERIREGEEQEPASPQLLKKLDTYLKIDNSTNTSSEITDNKEYAESKVIDISEIGNNNESDSVMSMDDEFELMKTAALSSESISASNAGQSDLITEEEFDNLLDEIHGKGTHKPSISVNNSEIITDDEFEAALDELHGKNKGPGSKTAEVSDKLDVSNYPDSHESKSEKNINTPKKSPVQKDSSVRVDTERLDDIMNLVGELVLVRNRLSMLKQVVEQEQLIDAISILELVTSDLQSSVMKTRMQPIKKVFSRFPRVIRDLAKQLDKDINLQLIGEETDLDKSLVEALADPLVHLVRNAADHGIESPEQRYSSGKPRQGTVTLSAQQEGDQILLTVTDDGKGMDHRELRRKAVETGMLNEDIANNLTDKEAYNLIFEPGFSTKTEISDVSGRGVGMDVVRTRINELSGSIEIDSKLGEGSVITIHLPLTLAILPTLMVMLGKSQYALPLSNVYEAFNMAPDKINVVDGQEVMRVRDKTLPLFYLRPWLVKQDTFDGPTIDNKVIVVQMGSQRFCLVVDNIVGQEEVVIKPLGTMLNTTPGFSGATITGDGSIALVLDIPSLMGKYATNCAA